jgi:NAD(P)-dependent dehydrogenase (short-subunit alcohol dehydrogenase family)
MMAENGGGSVVHIASGAGLHTHIIPLDGYSISKSSLIKFSQSLAHNWGRRGIRSNTICPGNIKTGIDGGAFDTVPGLLEANNAATPLGRLGTTCEVSHAVMFLLSDLASFITGVDLKVCGGLLLNSPYRLDLPNLEDSVRDTN